MAPSKGIKMANKKFKNALNCEIQNCPPIWFMRQAGRYHDHYQNLRAKHSFMELCKNPDLAAEVAMGPIRDFDFDVSILFSDLLFPLEAMGMGLKYEPAPELSWHFQEANQINKLKTLNECKGFFDFQKKALIETRNLLPESKSLIGFVGGPWTLFCYAVDGSHKGGLTLSKKMIPHFDSFCEILMPILKHNIEVQLEGGAEVVMIFDTASGELNANLFNELVAPYLIKLSHEYAGRLGYYSKGTVYEHTQKLFNEAKFLGFGFDHRFNMSDVFRFPFKGFRQGNFDQSLLFLDEKNFHIEAYKYLENIKKISPELRTGWVSGLGHGVLPQTPTKNVKKFVQMVREVFCD